MTEEKIYTSILLIRKRDELHKLRIEQSHEVGFISKSNKIDSKIIVCIEEYQYLLEKRISELEVKLNELVKILVNKGEEVK